MALLPLLKKDLIDPSTLVIDAKSGATGAGRKAAENLLFCEVEGECLPYKVGKHQHLPEIREHAEKLAGAADRPDVRDASSSGAPGNPGRDLCAQCLKA